MLPLGYEVKFETIHGNGADLQLRSLLDRQQFHDPLGEAERAGISSATWPIFGLLWPSGRVLAHAMVSFEVAGKRILAGDKVALELSPYDFSKGRITFREIEGRGPSAAPRRRVH